MSRKYIQHVRSTDVETIQEYGLDKIVPKLPEADNLMEGEIAINYAENNEVISIKNEQDEVVKFLNEKVIYENEEITAAAIAKINNSISEITNTQSYVVQLLDNCDPNAHSTNLYIAKDIDGNEIEEIDIIRAIKSKKLVFVIYHGGCFVQSFSTQHGDLCYEDAYIINDSGMYFVNIGDAVGHTPVEETENLDGRFNRTIRVIKFLNNNWSIIDIDFYTKQEVDQKIADAGIPDMSDYYTKEEVDDKIADAGIPDMSNYYTKSEIDNAGYLTSETQLSTNTVGNGNVVTNITVNGHQITLTKESTFLTQDEVQALIDEVVSGGADLTNYYTKSETNGLLEDKVDYLTFSSTQEMQNTTNGIRLGTIGVVDGEQSKDVYVLIYRNGNKEWYDVTTDNTGGDTPSGGGDDPIITHNTIETLTPTAELDRPIEVEVGDTYDEAFSKVLGIIEDNEQVTAEALTDLENDKANTEDLADVAFSGEYNDILNKPTLQMINENDLYYGVIGRANSNPGLNFNLQCNLNPLDPSTTIVTTVTDENLDNPLRPYFFNFKNDKLTFDYGQSNGSGYISAQEYSGNALGTEEKLTNAELLTDGAGMIGFYDEPNDEQITVRDALINLQDAVDGIEIITAGTGLTKSGSTLNHTNSVTANQNAVVKAFTFDSEGHIDSSADAAKYTIENIGTDIRFNDVFLRRCQKDYSTGSESGTNGNALTTQYVPVVTEATSRPNNDESNGEQLTPTTDPINNTDPVDAGGNSGGKAEMGDPRL